MNAAQQYDYFIKTGTGFSKGMLENNWDNILKGSFNE